MTKTQAKHTIIGFYVVGVAIRYTHMMHKKNTPKTISYALLLVLWLMGGLAPTQLKASTALSQQRYDSTIAHRPTDRISLFHALVAGYMRSTNLAMPTVIHGIVLNYFRQGKFKIIAIKPIMNDPNNDMLAVLIQEEAPADLSNISGQANSAYPYVAFISKRHYTQAQNKNTYQLQAYYLPSKALAFNFCYHNQIAAHFGGLRQKNQYIIAGQNGDRKANFIFTATQSTPLQRIAFISSHDQPAVPQPVPRSEQLLYKQAFLIRKAINLDEYAQVKNDNTIDLMTISSPPQPNLQDFEILQATLIICEGKRAENFTLLHKRDIFALLIGKAGASDADKYLAFVEKQHVNRCQAASYPIQAYMIGAICNAWPDDDVKIIDWLFEHRDEGEHDILGKLLCGKDCSSISSQEAAFRFSFDRTQKVPLKNICNPIKRPNIAIRIPLKTAEVKAQINNSHKWSLSSHDTSSGAVDLIIGVLPLSSLMLLIAFFGYYLTYHDEHRRSIQ